MTMKIDTIDKESLAIIRASIQLELDRLNKDFEGIKIQLGRGRFDSTQCTFKLHVVQTEKSAEKAHGLIEYNLAILNRLGENDKFRVVNYKTANRKMPWILQPKNGGQQVKASDQWIRNNMPPIPALPPIESVTPKFEEADDESFLREFSFDNEE